MKRISATFAAASMLLLFSCNNNPKEKTDTKMDDTAVSATTTTTPVAAEPVAKEPVFTPFKIFMVQHKVKNFDKWKVGYLAHDSMRTVYGISKFIMGRGMQDSNTVIVMDKMTDVQKAKDFAKMPGLKEAMMKAGVIGAPTFTYADVIRNDATPIAQKERVMVAHKVKDFDAWLKVYDAEGKATRAENGIMDRGMARGVDDANMVYLVFAITDMAKAKARMNSPEMKKVMTDAGVIGPPKVMFYRLVD